MAADGARARVARNGLWNVARVVVSLPVFLFFTRFLYDTLGDATRGAWALVGAFWLQPALLDLGVGEALTRAVARRRAHGAREVRRAILAGGGLLVGLALVLAFLYLGLRDWLVGLVETGAALTPGEVARALDLCALALGCNLFAWGVTKALQGLERYDLTSLLQLVTLVSFAGLGVLLLRGDPRLSALGEAALAAAALGLATGALLLSRLLRREATADDATATAADAPPPTSPLREMLAFGPVLYLSSLSGLVEAVVDKFLLGALGPGGAASAGYLDNASEIGGRLRTLPVLLAAPLYPAAAAATSAQERVDLYRGAARLNILVAAPLLVGGFAFATPFVRLWLGEAGIPDGARVHATAVALAILCLGLFLQVLYVPAYHLCNGLGRPWPGTLASLASAAVNVGLALYLVRDHGLRGVVIAIASGHAVACAFFLTWFHRDQGLSLARTILEELHPPLACMIAAAGAGVIALRALPLGWPAFLACTGGCVVLYGVLLLATGNVTVSQLRSGLAALGGRDSMGSARDIDG